MLNLALLIEGPVRSGKTSFIRSLTGESPFQDDPIGFVQVRHAFGFVRVSINATVTLYVVARFPSQAFRLDDFNIPVRPLGAIILADSAAPIWFPNVRHILANWYQEPYNQYPHIIAATKTDKADARPIAAIRAELQLAPQTPIVPCVTTQRESVRAVVRALLDAHPPDDPIIADVAAVIAP